MKSKILYSLLAGALIFSCNKKESTAVHPGVPAPVSTKPVTITGQWKAGSQTDIVTSQDPGAAPVTTTTAMPFDKWEFKEDGTLHMGNGSSSMSMKFTLLPGNKIAFSFRGVGDTMDILRQEGDMILLKEVRKRLDGKILTETLQLSRVAK